MPSGLENAVQQAEERGFQEMFIFDSDCHQMESFRTMAKYVKDPLKNVLLQPDPEVDYFQKALYDRLSGKWGQEVTRHMRGVETVKRPETSESRAPFQEAEELIGIYTELMHRIGIKSSIVLPTQMLGVSSLPDIEVTVANAYIDYMLGNFLGKYPEFLTLAYVPTNDPSKAVELLDRVASEKGIAGLMIPGQAQTLGGSDRLDSIYELAQNKGLPVCFHGGRSGFHDTYKGMEFVGAHALSFPLSVIRHLTSIVLSGVPVRFPRLRFVFMEGGVTWIPWLYNRLDDEYVKRRIEAPLLEKLPSEYMKEFYYTSQPLEQCHPEMLEPIFNMMDFENHLLYASDYPHWDFDVPSVIYDLPFLSESAKKKILGENARKVFKLNN